MNTATASTTTTVTCPRCHGFDAFARFGHVANGRCLRCFGAGTVEVATWKLAQQRASTATARAAALAEQVARPYIVAVDGMETIASTYTTWAAAHSWAKELGSNDDGDAFRVAKFDGSVYRYRDGVEVRLGHH